MQKIATPHASSIEELAAFLKVPASKTAKAVFYTATLEAVDGKSDVSQFVFAVVRGDMEVNETKLTNLVKAKELRPATEEEIRAVGAEPGYASPVGLKDVFVIVDDLIPQCANLVAGANEAGYHLLNVNYRRDFTATLVADICAASEGSACPNCGTPMRLTRGVEIGNIFKLGTRYTDALGCTYLDETGASRPVVMGSYGIGVGRLLACVAEEHHDERGLIWPQSIAPFPVHLVVLLGKSVDTWAVAETLEKELTAAGLEPLVDDRAESAGVKFNDADLIGIPLRITVSERALKQGGVEFKRRSGGEPWIVPAEKVLSAVKELQAAG